jgi:Lecithin retinol acyltransferase
MSREDSFGTHDAGLAILGAREWLLAAGDTPPLAAHVVTSRTGYTHHGIYVGDGKVVHYPGLSRGWRGGPVEEVSLAEFARGRRVRVRPHMRARFDRDDVVARARSRLGEDCYRLLSNNCEHFCEWCVHGENRSRQVETLRARPRCVLLAALRVLVRPARLRSPLGSPVPW